MRNQRRLNLAHRSPIDRRARKLRPEQIEIFQALRAIDEIGIGNRVRRTRKKIRQAHLVTHTNWQYIQREIKRTGDLLENVVEEFVCYGISTQQGIPKLTVPARGKGRTLTVMEPNGQGLLASRVGSIGTTTETT